MLHSSNMKEQEYWKNAAATAMKVVYFRSKMVASTHALNVQGYTAAKSDFHLSVHHRKATLHQQSLWTVLSKASKDGISKQIENAWLPNNFHLMINPTSFTQGDYNHSWKISNILSHDCQWHAKFTEQVVTTLASVEEKPCCFHPYMGFWLDSARRFKL